MKQKEKDLLKQSFANSDKCVFNDKRQAQQVHELLNENGVKHSYGEYLHEMKGGGAKYDRGVYLETGPC